MFYFRPSQQKVTNKKLVAGTVGRKFLIGSIYFEGARSLTL